jgi:Leucine-rich repeat (LRR) protein
VRITLILLFAVIAFETLHAQEKELIYNDTTYIYRSIAEASANPDKVFRLNLSKTRLDSFPIQVCSFKNLQELDLSKNRIEEVPPEIGQLVNLRRLNLANNQLVHLPAEIGQLRELVFLGLNRNILEDLPPTIGDLQNLEVLELWDNELKDIPDEISQLQNLKLIELRGILFTEEQQHRIDTLVVKSAKIYMSPSCNCKN